jgi:hypothetical protein
MIPKDPRRVVKFRRGDRLYRIHPEDMERPVAVLTKAEFVAKTIDPVLNDRFGFGLSDFLDLALLYMDEAVEQLAPTWTHGPPDDPRDCGEITEEEVACYRRLPDPSDLVDRCAHPGSAKRALRWATRHAGTVVDTQETPQERFGSALAVSEKNGHIVGEPPSACCGAVDLATIELSRVAAAADHALELQFFQRSCNAVTTLLRRLNYPTSPMVRGPGGAAATLLVEVSEKAFIAIEVVSSLGTVPLDMDDAAERLLRLVPGQTLDGPLGQVTLPIGARVVRLIIATLPGHAMVPSVGGVAGMSLEDLDWISSELIETSDDLWWFLKDLCEQPGIQQMFAFETINVFENWRERRTLLTSGRGTDLLLIEPYGGDAEYWRAERLLPLEEALLACGLPATRWFDGIEAAEHGQAVTYRSNPRISVRILPGPLPMCLTIRRNSVPDEHADFVWKVCTGMAWKLSHIPPPTWIADRFGVRGLTIEIGWHEGSGIIETAGEAGAALLLLSEAAFNLCVEDATAFEIELGRGLTASLISGIVAVEPDDSDIEALGADWNAAPAGIRMDGYAMAQRETHPPAPQPVSIPARRAVERELNQKLVDQGITPGSRRGDPARDFESKLVTPNLLSMLHESLSKFDGAELLSFGVRQCDLGHASRIIEERKLSFGMRFEEPGKDPVAATKGLVEKSQRLTRAQSIIVEELLAQPPGGNELPDRFEWGELMAIAEVLLDSEMRSESIHFGLSPVEIVLTDDYEIEVNEVEGEARFDLAAFTEAFVEFTKIGPKVPLLREADDPPSDDPGLGELAPVDAAILDSLGFHLTTLTGILHVLRGWDRDPGDPPVYWTTTDEIVSYCDERLVDVNADEIRAALDRLILTRELLGSEMLEHWEQERRDARLLTRPLIRRTDGLVAVMPWLVESTYRVYMRYLVDGRLPWPRIVTPEPVLSAVATYRQSQNDQLEDEVYDVVVSLGLPCRKRVKPNKAHVIGLNQLTGEIDTVLADPGRRIIWVLETKDPQEAFSARQQANGLTQFLGTETREGYVSTLCTKVIDVDRGAEAVAKALGATDSTGPWSVRGAMVTRRPVPAAFAGAGVPFTTVRDLAEFLTEPPPD